MKMTNETDGLKSCAAWGDGHADVPNGYVIVEATPGGRRDVRGKYYLVPAAEYANESILIDPERHAEARDFVPYDRDAFLCGRTSGSQGANPQSEAVRSPSSASDGAKIAENELTPNQGTALPWSEILSKLGATKGGGLR
jgi:hypothetical protein